MASRRNVFGKQGSPRGLYRQGSLRNAFRQGSLRHIFKSSRGVGNLRDSSHTDRAINGEDRSSQWLRRETQETCTLPSLKEQHNSGEEERRRMKANKERKKKKKEPSGDAAVRKKKKKPTAATASDIKKKRRSGGAKTRKTKNAIASSSNEDRVRDLKHRWWSSETETSERDETTKSEIARRRPSGRRSPEAHSPKLLTPRSCTKSVHVDMSGHLDLTYHSNTEPTQHSHTEHTQTEHTHDTLHSLCSLPLVRKIPQSPSTPVAARSIGRSSVSAGNSPGWLSQATSQRTSDDDISLLSEEEYSDQIMDDLSCVLDCDEDEDATAEQQRNKRAAANDDEDDELIAEEIIEDDEEISYYSQNEEEERSYVDLYCSPMKRISDLTGATPHISVCSFMHDDDLDEAPIIPKRPSYVSPAPGLGRRNSMSRISELTEITMHELERYDYLEEEDENGKDYDCSSIVSSDSASFLPKTPSTAESAPRQTRPRRSSSKPVSSSPSPRGEAATSPAVRRANAVWKDRRFGGNAADAPPTPSARRGSGGALRRVSFTEQQQRRDRGSASRSDSRRRRRGGRN